MSSTEAISDAKSRLKGRLTEIGIPAGFSDEIIGRHTLVNYNKAVSYTHLTLPTICSV